MKKVTMDFLAKELNMSKTTVSKALNNCPGINPNRNNSPDKDILSHILVQDIQKQAKTAWECAQNFVQRKSFPDQKNVYIDGLYYNI